MHMTTITIYQCHSRGLLSGEGSRPLFGVRVFSKATKCRFDSINDSWKEIKRTQLQLKTANCAANTAEHLFLNRKTDGTTKSKQGAIKVSITFSWFWPGHKHECESHRHIWCSTRRAWLAPGKWPSPSSSPLCQWRTPPASPPDSPSPPLVFCLQAAGACFLRNDKDGEEKTLLKRFCGTKHLFVSLLWGWNAGRSSRSWQTCFESHWKTGSDAILSVEMFLNLFYESLFLKGLMEINTPLQRYSNFWKVLKLRDSFVTVSDH